MNEILPPKVGGWYQNSIGDQFEVVAYDEDETTIEIQYFDGTVEEIDMEYWTEDYMEPIEAPDDWSGSYDIDKEDYKVDLDNQTKNEHRNPLDEIDH